MTLEKVQHNWRMVRATRLAASIFGLLLVAASSYAQTVIKKETTVSQLDTLQLDAVPQTDTAEIRSFHFQCSRRATR